jgi:pyruvate/2-oxoglutarate dehydrogenase complex dihydrolipoamide dehydrogenase (E3) component
VENVGFRPRTALAARLGCALDENGYVAADPMDRQTTVYAAGSCADPMQNVAMAIADGARAGVMINLRLATEGFYSSSRTLSPLT